jgi:hypothetical protein
MTIRRTVEPHAANIDYTHAERALEILPEHVLPKARAAMRIIADTANHLLRSCSEEGIAACNCDGIREIEALTFAMLRAKEIPQDEIHAAMDCGRRLTAAEDDPVETLRIMNAVTTAWERLGRAA